MKIYGYYVIFIFEYHPKKQLHLQQFERQRLKTCLQQFYLEFNFILICLKVLIQKENLQFVVPHYKSRRWTTVVYTIKGRITQQWPLGTIPSCNPCSWWSKSTSHISGLLFVILVDCFVWEIFHFKSFFLQGVGAIHNHWHNDHRNTFFAMGKKN